MADVCPQTQCLKEKKHWALNFIRILKKLVSIVTCVVSDPSSPYANLDAWLNAVTFYAANLGILSASLWIRLLSCSVEGPGGRASISYFRPGVPIASPVLSTAALLQWLESAGFLLLYTVTRNRPRQFTSAALNRWFCCLPSGQLQSLAGLCSQACRDLFAKAARQLFCNKSNDAIALG